MKKILILNGSPRKNGKTESLVKAFTEGAQQAGHEVKELYLHSMIINGCLGCNACRLGKVENCVQRDDMDIVFDEFIQADVVVFATPVMWRNVSAQLRLATDRFYAYCWDKEKTKIFEGKQVALIMTAGADGYMSQDEIYGTTMDWYEIWSFKGMKSIGTILGQGKESEAFKLGTSIR